VQVTSNTYLPILISAREAEFHPDWVLDRFIPGLAVGYSLGPPFGEQMVTWPDLEKMRVSRRTVKRQAEETLYQAMSQVRIHGQPPSLMLSFEGLESTVLLVEEFWNDLAEQVPGELVIGVPARDVVIVTGSGSQPGLAKTRRAVERMFFAGGTQLLMQELLVWRDGSWTPLPPPEESAPEPEILLPELDLPEPEVAPTRTPEPIDQPR
jgi:uncharacterized protein YtpQ (UPF0354 family)